MNVPLISRVCQIKQKTLGRREYHCSVKDALVYQHCHRLSSVIFSVPWVTNIIISSSSEAKSLRSKTLLLTERPQGRC